MLIRFLLFQLILAPVLVAQDSRDIDTARIEQLIAPSVANHSFMGTVLLARGERVLFSKGFGYANLEWQIPNMPDTRFRLGSVTKQFTAASILLLEERGKLSVDDPVRKYLPDAPARWEQITIRHLLTHTSGIPNFTSFPEYSKLEPFAATPTELVARFRDKPLDFDPGTKWSYSNSGFVLLGWLIEKVSGETYEKFVAGNIFGPLGMKDSGYDSNAAVLPHRASGYVQAKGGFENAGFIHMSIPHAAGALYSTTEDLLRWERGLFGGKLLKPASLEKMTTPFLQNYAFGVTVATAGGRKVISHDGGIEGFNTRVAYYPEDKLTVIVLSNVNGSGPDEIAGRLASFAYGEKVQLPSERKEISLDPKLLDRYPGVYEVSPGANMAITRDGNQLFGKLGGQPALPLYPESETIFFLKAVDAQIEFAAGERPAQLTLHQNGNDLVARRLDDAAAKRVADSLALAAQRFKDQKADPHSEAALRRSIEELRKGQPDYSQMTAAMADVTRRQLASLQSQVVELGAVEAVTFKGVGTGGRDIYEVRFSKGTIEFRIGMAADSKIEGLAMRAL